MADSLLLLRLHRRTLQQGADLFTVLMCADCQTARGLGSGPYTVMTRAQMRAGLDLLSTWALEQKASANRQVIVTMRTRLAAGEDVARMYQKPGLAWLERQAEVAKELVAQRKRTAENRPRP
jgi:3-keto-L-gulonate-6-phosphate decarboxylase